MIPFDTYSPLIVVPVCVAHFRPGICLAWALGSTPPWLVEEAGDVEGRLGARNSERGRSLPGEGVKVSEEVEEAGPGFHDEYVGPSAGNDDDEG